MSTKLGKLKQDINKSGQAADDFTPTEKWVWEKFQFFAAHIQEVVRRNVASFTEKLQPSSALGTHPASSPDVEEIVVTTPSCNQPASTTTPTSTPIPPTTAARSDVLGSILEQFTGQRQSTTHPTTYFGYYVGSTMRGFPPNICRDAEKGIMQVLHDCHHRRSSLSNTSLHSHSHKIGSLPPHSGQLRSKDQPVSGALRTVDG
eukprot:GHVU01030044.1.p1 GENE.GHVU01030044.1~~GHVU01030044.1.p1  ORF type:complete len:203 (-),score=12.36 GHVU01030044.1:53-661(-)